MHAVMKQYAMGGAKFTPASIAGLTLWLDASDASTITQVANAVSQWRDKSGNNNHGNQATGTAQPLVQAAAQNGLNTLGFTSAASKRLALTTQILPSGFTLAVVGQKSSNNWAAITGVSGSINYGLFHFTDSIFYSVIGANQRLSTSSPLSLAAYTSAVIANSGVVAGSTLLYNGLSQPLATNIPGDGVAWDSIGGSSNAAFTDGSIAEIVLYNSVLPTTQLTQLYNYLKAKWGTP